MFVIASERHASGGLSCSGSLSEVVFEFVDNIDVEGVLTEIERECRGH